MMMPSGVVVHAGSDASCSAPTTFEEGVHLYHTIEVWGIGGDNVGLIKSTKAPKFKG